MRLVEQPALLAHVAAMVLTSPARADDASSPQAEARRAFELGAAQRDAGHPAKAIAAFRRVLVYQARGEPQSSLAAEAARQIGELYRAICAFDLAAEWLERSQNMAPRAAGADRALLDAIVLRIALGQADEAIRDANEHVRTYSPGAPRARTAARLLEKARADLDSMIRTPTGAPHTR